MSVPGSNRKIRLLIQAIQEESLIPNPEFQRRLVWTSTDKQRFINTVLENLPFPEIYIAAGDVDVDTARGTELLVDGQQRITTLFEYFSGSPNLKLSRGIEPYSELTQQEKSDFLEYQVVVRDLGPRSKSEIIDIFTRLNSTSYSLNAMEVQNARYNGAFKQCADAIAQDEFFDHHRTFSVAQIRRMADTQYALTLMISVISAYFNRTSEIESYLGQYNDEFERDSELITGFKKVFRTIERFDFDATSRAWNAVDLFTLIVEIYRLSISEGIRLNKTKPKKSLEKFYREVQTFAAELKEGTSGPVGEETDNESDPHHIRLKSVRDYYRATIQATNDRSSRIKRGHIIRQLLLPTSGSR